MKDYIRKGQRIILYGKVEQHDRLQITQPEYELLKGDDTDSIHIGRIVPVYAASAGLSQRYMRTLTFAAVTNYAKSLAEKMPTYIMAREKLVDIRFAVRNIHFPGSFDNLEKAYRRVVFDEFFLLQLALAVKRKGVKLNEEAPSHTTAGKLVEAFNRDLRFELTAGQKKAIADIGRDMSSGRPMNRLVEGDVGSGKTIVAAYGLVLTAQNGFQGCIMAPTEVLARQHFITLSEMLMPLGLNVALLIGGINDDAKNGIVSEIRAGNIDIVVGTHALIQEKVEFKQLGLAVIDEQHKFGVTQRATLRQKGYSPHILVMTATPIPRTLAMTVYGDLDISIIREMPKGRKPIATYWVEETKRDDVYRFVKEELVGGRQAYVICPLIDGGQRPGFKGQGEGAIGMFEKLKSDVFRDFEVGLMHGRLPSKEKDNIMQDFKKKKIQVLVSTIVIEVGIDIPNATIMLIENAERFGLSQLHQLRGRIGRGEHESFCILLADPKTEEAAKRLKAMEGTLDGFQIAETDLDIRGPGEFFGTRQHGLPEIRFGNIVKDFDIMEAARREAFGLVDRDPGMSEEHHRLLGGELELRFKNKLRRVDL